MESQITIRLSEALHRRLDQAAKSLGRRRSDLARLAVQHYLDEIEGESAPRPTSAFTISSGPWTAASPTSGPDTATTSSRISAAVADLLLDTGAWVALLDRREREHPRCVQTLQGFSGRLTLDRRGFGVYRLRGRRSLQIVP